MSDYRPPYDADNPFYEPRGGPGSMDPPPPPPPPPPVVYMPPDFITAPPPAPVVDMPPDITAAPLPPSPVVDMPPDITAAPLPPPPVVYMPPDFITAPPLPPVFNRPPDFTAAPPPPPTFNRPPDIIAAPPPPPPVFNRPPDIIAAPPPPPPVFNRPPDIITGARPRSLPPIPHAQRDPSNLPSPPAATGYTAPPVKAEVESLLNTFTSATSDEAKNAAAMQAVKAIIRAYGMSTKGLSTMRFNPDLPAEHRAETPHNERVSQIEFGPGAFKNGFEPLVHTVAHELEHVRQHLIAGYQSENDYVVKEFLAYNSSILQVQSVAGPAGKGLLGAQMTGTDQSAPALPPLPPDQLASTAELALENFSKMPSAAQKKPQYRQELAAARDKLFERLKNEAPQPLRPPPKFTPEWTRWYEGQAPTLDIFTPEYQDWQDSLTSPWVQVKAVWKRFDAAFRG